MCADKQTDGKQYAPRSFDTGHKYRSRLSSESKKLGYTRAKESILSELKLVAPDLKLGTHCKS